MNATSRSSLPTRVLFGVASTLALVHSGQAQQAAATGTSTNKAVIEEITVTANRREESLQDVSASITAFSSADIEHKGFDSFTDFAGSVPGLTINQPTKNRATFNIRGVTLNAGSGGNTQDPVSVYINDTPVTDTFGAIVTPDLRLFDVERIEVLRGPQGTLFGSGSLSGTVRIITNKPDATKVEAAGRVDFGSTQGGAFRQRYDGMINLPLIDDKLALRAVGYYRDEEGWVKNVLLGTRNDSEDWGGRIAMLWQPNDALSVKAELIHQNSDPADGDRWNPALGKFNKSSAIPEGRRSKLTNASLTIAYDFANFATLSSITTQQSSDSSNFGDVGDVFGLGAAVLSKSDPWNTDFFVQELRLVSNTQSPWQWVAGAFFIDREANVNYQIVVPGLNDFLGGALGGRDDYFVSQIRTTSQELAAYGDLTYQITDAFKFNVGARVFRTKAGYFEPHREVFNFDFVNPGYVSSSVSNAGKDSDYTWRTGLSYDVSDSALVYANVSKGFRVGQVNPNNGPSFVDPSDIVIPMAYGADYTINYELGAKTSWLDNRLVANLALYYIDWRDIQIDGQRLSDRLAFVANAGGAVSKGVELELSARPSEALTLYTAMSYQDAKITEVPDNIVVPASKGDVLPGLVHFKISGGFEYRWDLGGKQLYVRADGQHVGKSPNNLANGGTYPFYAINQAYDNVDAAIGLVFNWGEVTLYGENLTNNDAFIYNDGGLNPNSITTLRPLTTGIRVNVKY